MVKPLKIPSTIIFVTVALLAAGEVATGTQPIFAAYMAATLICIGVTYNLLGGIGTISGIAFSTFAASSIVISQFAKVILREPADKPLESAALTIKIYFVFYLCVMIGTFVYRSLRINLPKPLEPSTLAQADIQYKISLAVGVVASLAFEYYESAIEPSARISTAHSIGLALSPLLLFSIVLGVQDRIRTSHGRHSLGIRALIPCAITVFFGFLETSRSHMLMAAAVYLFTCYVSGYRFRFKHLATLVLGIAAFNLVVSPFEIYSRGPMRELDFRGRLREGFELIRTVPAWSVVEEASLGGVESGSREEYYDRPGTFVLSRLSAIRADSNMISACSGGFHYGFTALKLDVRRSLPRFLDKNKPDTDGASYTGRVTGINGDDIENGEFVLTAISDSYGAFGWIGVIVVGMIGFPTVFIVYESMFDIHKPWGIVATGAFCFQFAEVSMGGMLGLLVRAPVAIVLLSYAVGLFVRMIPIKGDSGVEKIEDFALWNADPADQPNA